MSSKYLPVVVVALAAFLLIVSPTGAESNIDLSECLDYRYMLDFQGVSDVTLVFYTVENEELTLFKNDFSAQSEKSSTLHCGHDYHAVYTVDGYEPFEEDFTISNNMPIKSEIKEIKLIKIKTEEVDY